MALLQIFGHTCISLNNGLISKIQTLSDNRGLALSSYGKIVMLALLALKDVGAFWCGGSLRVNGLTRLNLVL